MTNFLSMRRLVVTIATLIFIHWPVTAQTLPSNINSGTELLRQQERDSQLRRHQESRPDVTLQTPAPQATDIFLTHDESPCFAVQHIILTGELSEQFQWLVSATERTSSGKEDSPLNHCLGAAALNQIMVRMQNALIERGYVTSRVLMPTQVMNKATLEYKFIPGRIRNIRFDSQSSSRATQWNAMPAKVGDLVNLRDIEQALENFKRVPTAEADIKIAASDPAIARPGDSDIIIKWRQALPFRMSLGVDNSGSKATGRHMGSATFSYDHWWTLNDLFYVSLNKDLGGGDKGDRESRGRMIHYSLPVGYSLLSVTASSNSYYQEVAGVNGNSHYAGNADNLELKLSHVAYRDAFRKTTASFALWLRESTNKLNDATIDNQKRRMAGWEAGLHHRENMGDVLLELSGSYRRGTGAWGALHAPEELTGTGTSRPQITRLNAQLSAPFSIASQALRYSLSFSGQRSQTNLVPQDRFAIGSRYTVRGFDEQSFLSAEHGWTMRNDLSLALGQSPHQLYVGVDHGEVRGRSTQNLVGTQLTGVALGLRGAIQQLRYDVFAAKPLSKPQGFTTDPYMVGFSLMLAY